MLIKLQNNVMLRTRALYNHQFLDMYLIQHSPIKLKVTDVEMIFHLVQVAVLNRSDAESYITHF
jgi:hypothetical protein